MYREDQSELEPMEDHPLYPPPTQVELRSVSAVEWMQDVDSLGADGFGEMGTPGEEL